MDKALKARIAKWVKETGRERAGNLLVKWGVHIDTAVRILNGTYTAQPKDDLKGRIEGAMEEGKDNV